MTKRWFLFSLWIVTGCLPQPSSDVQKARPELTIKGRILHSSESLSGRTAVYLEQNSAPEALSADDGSFDLTLDTERLAALRLQYGLQNSRLHLYFVPENADPESAVIDSINLESRGEMDLGNVLMQPNTTVTGRVVAYGAPVPEARVRLGRQELITAEDGSFSADVPAQLSTPLLVEKRGFVQTKGTWLASVQERDLELYSDLTPVGSIAAEPTLRNAGNTPISLSYSANGAAYWIRFAGRAEVLDENYESDAPWLDLRQPLQILSAPVIYYQFADRDQKILGPVLSYTPATVEE
ncbi:MAG TPA: hypothetical protein VE954_08395 [Oligoflexus sp.]|uniref:hypothetical protein n=1 Tax=Oligoflexus sp. TaxID=1971216 RepID=UPI002D285525|nr:hypothetical protein [Oligoflexus sp.]HYX33123.1 hypothetical protein [Oligoflexus sp.]